MCTVCIALVLQVRSLIIYIYVVVSSSAQHISYPHILAGDVMVLCRYKHDTHVHTPDVPLFPICPICPCTIDNAPAKCLYAYPLPTHTTHCMLTGA